MASTLIIGPTVRDARNAARIAAVLRECLTDFPQPLNLDISEVDCVTGDGVATDTAAAFLDVNGQDILRIAVNYDWFKDRTLDQQKLTLLHECIHLKFMTDGLRQHTIDGYAWRKDCEDISMDRDLLCLAYAAWSRVQESVAELYLQAHYPSAKEKRLDVLDDFATTDSLSNTSDLQTVAALIELLQSDLLMRLSTETPVINARATERMRSLEPLALSGVRIPKNDVMAFRRELDQVRLKPLKFQTAACIRVTQQILKLSRPRTGA